MPTKPVERLAWCPLDAASAATALPDSFPELQGVEVGLETLRKWLIDAGVWQTRAERRKRPQPPRAPRECFGELVQIDGCDHTTGSKIVDREGLTA